MCGGKLCPCTPAERFAIARRLTPQLGETLVPFLLPLEGLLESLTALKEARGWALDSRLVAFALGIKVAAKGSAAAPVCPPSEPIGIGPGAVCN